MRRPKTRQYPTETVRRFHMSKHGRRLWSIGERVALILQDKRPCCCSRARRKFRNLAPPLCKPCRKGFCRRHKSGFGNQRSSFRIRLEPSFHARIYQTRTWSTMGHNLATMTTIYTGRRQSWVRRRPEQPLFSWAWSVAVDRECRP